MPPVKPMYRQRIGLGNRHNGERGALPFAHSVAPRIGNSKANIPAKDDFAIPSPISLAPGLS